MEEARKQVAWLMRELELAADGAKKIVLYQAGKPMTEYQTELWARANAKAIRDLLEGCGLSTAWHSDLEDQPGSRFYDEQAERAKVFSERLAENLAEKRAEQGQRNSHSQNPQQQ